MKILIIGSGGREYSIALALLKEKQDHDIYFAPGNGATSKLGTNVDISDFDELSDFAISEGITFTIVGPEDPLVAGIVDIFESKNLVIFGPNKKAAQLEGSKIYMKNFLKENSIPTARFLETSSLKDASEFIKTLPTPIVVKADGLCAGKGVIIASTHEEAIKSASDMLSGESFGDSGKSIVVEEFLDGYELSVFAICDGSDYKILPASQDHKKLFDEDKGPNTGGMGAYAPTPLINDTLYKKIEENILKPTLSGMKNRDAIFKGVLFIGLMIVKGEPIVIEYNVRFGDPECEVLMPLIKTPISELLYKASIGELRSVDLKIEDKVAVCVILASKDYPYKSSLPSIIDVKQGCETNSHVVYAGVGYKDNHIISTGGRVIACVGMGQNIKEAHQNAYNLIDNVQFDGMQYRKDIAYQAL